MDGRADSHALPDQWQPPANAADYGYGKITLNVNVLVTVQLM